jgi:ABC-type glycerol-3-phosphate transport system substrate-binding protein
MARRSKIAALCAIIAIAAAAAPAAAQDKAPVTLRMLRPAADQDPEKDPILLELQRRTGVKLEIVTAPWDQIWNKLNIMMASGESIDLIQADDGASPIWQWAKEGLMYDLRELASKEKTPFVDAVLKADAFKSFYSGGKAYFMPAVHHGPDWCFYIRADWLKKVGMGVPKDTEQLYKVLKAFKDKQLGGPGTVGLEVYLKSPDNYEPFQILMQPFGGSGAAMNNHDFWVGPDGKVRWTMLEKGTKDALAFLNKCYREGLINSDFASLKSQPEAHAKYLYAGKSGMMYDAEPTVANVNVKKVDPNAEFAYLPPIDGGGAFLPLAGGPPYWLFIGIPKASKHPQEAMRFLEYCNSKEGRTLLVAGIQGRHYSAISEDGVYDRNRAGWEKDYDVKQWGYEYPMWWGFLGTTHGYVPIDKYPSFDEAFKHEIIFLDKDDATKTFNTKTQIANMASWSKFNPLQGIPVPEEVNPIFMKIHQDLKARYWLKMIIEKDPSKIEGLWAEFVAGAKKAGSDKVIAAYQKYYDANLR